MLGDEPSKTDHVNLVARAASTHAGYAHERYRFSDWYDQLDEEARVTLFGENPPAGIDDILVENGPELTFEILRDYFLDRAINTPGQRGKARVRTILNSLNTFCQAYLFSTGRSISARVRLRIRRYIEVPIARRLKLSTEPFNSTLISPATFKAIALTWFDETFSTRTLRNRIQRAAFYSFLYSTCHRLGAILSHPLDSKKQPLRWRDCSITLTPRPDGSENDFTFCFVTLNGKGESGKGDAVELETPKEVYLDSALFFVMLAHLDDVLPEGWTFEKLLDPKSLPSPSPLKLSFAKSKAALPVFRMIDHSKDNVSRDSKQPALPSTLHSAFKRNVIHLALYPAPTPHSLRRSGGVNAKLRGK